MIPSKGDREAGQCHRVWRFTVALREQTIGEIASPPNRRR
jgi:hypothetical protein